MKEVRVEDEVYTGIVRVVFADEQFKVDGALADLPDTYLSDGATGP